jgi:excinuclease UvrABC ATPase subunit
MEQGNSVVVIEHNLDVIKTADHILDLNLDFGGGVRGGRWLRKVRRRRWLQSKGTPPTSTCAPCWRDDFSA